LCITFVIYQESLHDARTTKCKILLLYCLGYIVCKCVSVILEINCFNFYFSFPHPRLVGKISLVILTYLWGLQNYNCVKMMMMMIMVIIVIIIILPFTCTCCTWYEMFLSIFNNWSYYAAVYKLRAVWRNVGLITFICKTFVIGLPFRVIYFILTFPFLYRGADKSLARPGKKQATATEDFEFHMCYL
jgi:hypothetical protein